MIARARQLLLALLVATGAPGAAAAIRVVDDAGIEVAVPSPPQRIVSLAPHATELLHALGAGARVVGVSAASDWPREARGLPVVGDARSLDLERIVALKPDLVVTWPYTAPAQVERLRTNGLPVFVLDARSLDQLPSQIDRVGRLVGEDARGRALAATVRSRLDGLRSRYRGASRLPVFYEIWNEPLFTVGGGHLISQAIELCGGVNPFAGLSLPAPQVTLEAVLAARPQAIIAGTAQAKLPAWLDTWRRWDTLPAVANGQLHVVDADLLHRAGPRFVDGVESLCRAIDLARSGETQLRTARSAR